MAGSLLVRLTVVSPGCTALSATVSVPFPPWGIVRDNGSRLMIVGRGRRTVTVVLAVGPAGCVAVTVVVPEVRPPTKPAPETLATSGAPLDHATCAVTSRVVPSVNVARTVS